MKLKSSLIISACAMAALALTIGINTFNVKYNAVYAYDLNTQSIIEQSVTSRQESTQVVYKVVVDNQLVGYLQSLDQSNALLKEIYNQRYSESFPNKSLYFGNRIQIIEEPSFLNYENKDQEIVEYLKSIDDYMIETNAIHFSDDNGTYATIYVNDYATYEQAFLDYLAIFVGSEDLNILRHGGSSSTLTSYGSRNVSIDIAQTITTEKTYAYSEDIFLRYDQVLYYLKYGTLSELEYTEVQPYESIYALAARYGLDSERLRIINSETLKSVDQALAPGTTLCVTWLESPIDVIVEKETLSKEIVYPDSPIYVEDETMRLGEQEIQQEAVDGSRNVLRSEQWINGQVVGATEISSQITTLPQQAIIRQGSKVIPGIGTGIWRWPVDVPRISSRVSWDPVHPGYAGHNGTDIQNFYNRYGNIYAVDNGVVEIVDYDSIRGNWVLINHNNGVKSQYNHMNTVPYVKEGDVVEKGDIIGQIGTTGVTTGPHVHLGVWVDNVAQNACDGWLDCDGLDW